MKGKYSITIKNNVLQYQFEIRRNITIIKGDSATGKTTLIDMIREYYENGKQSGITLQCEKTCAVLEGRQWRVLLQNIHDSIVFIDEGNSFITTDEFASALKQSDNYYVIVTREGLPNLPYSVDEIYGIRMSDKSGTLQQTYQEFYHIYNNTIGYYENHADEFYKNTVDVEFSKMQEHFLKKLQSGSYILDFGCGSGRDTKFFLKQGYRVDAVDGSRELCKLAHEYTGIEVKNMLFQELSEVDKYDGIWACSSILHLPKKELADVMGKMIIALKENGIIYTSFKYGTFAGERNGRYFTDMTEETFAEFLSVIDDVEVEEQWTTSDVRPGRGEEKWLNLILRKR